MSSILNASDLTLSNTYFFYRDLHLLHDSDEMFDFEKYDSVPKDWSVVLTDVRNSTKAIENGKYKDVNMIGSAVIAALQNLDSTNSLPFVFGGDGAMILIPSALVTPAANVLGSLENLARTQFDLEIRINIIPLSDLYEQSYDLHVAKMRISEIHTQALLYGSVIQRAEHILKHDDNRTYSIENLQTDPQNADFSGLTCRWQDIYSRHGEVVSLIVQSTQKEGHEATKTYKKVLRILHDVLGSEMNYHPLTHDQLKLSLRFSSLSNESKINTLQVKKSFSRIRQLALQMWLWLINISGEVQDKLSLTLPYFSIEEKKSRMLASTDYKKFDGILRMVIAVSSDQRIQITQNLQKLAVKGEIKYGVHVSNRAVLTCLVFNGIGQEVHFVDGADGGYALAAKLLKKQINIDKPESFL